MENVKKGDFIVNADGTGREEVLARVEDLIYTRAVYEDGQKSAVLGPTHIEDAIGRGFRLEGEAAPASEGDEDAA
jgi:hypothetical protein